MKGSFPLVPSVFVYATVWGGLARQAGLSLGEIALMCLIVTAGASQFVAVPMIAAGFPPLAVIVTTYVVNMRHYLMAATLAPAFRGFPRRWLALIAHGVNDESFAEPAGPLVLPGERRGRVWIVHRRGPGRVRARRPRQRPGPLRSGLRLPRGLPRIGGRPAAPPGRLGSGRRGGAPGALDRLALSGQLAHRRRGPRGQRSGRAHHAAGGRVRLGVLVTIVGMAAATYLTRAPLLLALSDRPLRPRLRLWLRLIPLAVLPALAIPMVLLMPDGSPALTPANPRLWGALVVLALAAARANLLLSVAAGVVMVALLRHFGF
ncbi:MAG: AzlC family ABC transporter permease [Candidatus Rokubacteria bacterium]|nr:AzlC family ABC transporter permease [Candidatus Rokubacteria bacterium]